MAIATKTKPKTTQHKKRTASHHRQTKHYVKSYWPYLPMVAVLALGLLVNSVLSRPSAVLGSTSNLTQTALLDATNVDRIDNKRPALSLSGALQQAAQTKANDMVIQDYWSHNSPDGTQPWTYVTKAGYAYQAAGENLAYGFSDASAVMNAWMGSSEHRANLLSDIYTEVGFGVAQSQNFQSRGPQVIVVAMYAQPAVDPGAAIQTSTPLAAESVSRIETTTLPAASGFAIGVLATLAAMMIFVRHGIAWRKFVNKGELFVLQHPLLDTVLVGAVVTAVILTSTVGFIR